MEISFIRNTSIFFIFILVLNLCACMHRPPPPPRSDSQYSEDIPDIIKIDFTISDYKIVEHRIVDGPSNINLRYAGKYSDGKNIYFRLDEYPITDYYWLIKMPDIRNGNWTGEARIVRPYYQNTSLYRLPAPPDEIRIDVKIVDGYIKYHSIENFNHGTFGLYVKDIADIDDKKICSIKSKIYRDEEWKFILPKQDGDFRLVAKRIINRMVY